MNSPLNNNTTQLEALLAKVNALPEAGGVDLPELTNEGSASDLLSGKELIDGDGNVVTGTIPTKTSSNLTASGATVTVPAGYYASNATKSVGTIARAETTISVTKDDTNDKLTLTASNNQSTGYVTGANKTATKTVTLTTSGATATMSDGTNSVSKSVATGSAKTPATTITKNPSISVNSSGLITASVSGTQNVTPTVTAGYVSSGTAGTITVSGSATKQLTTQSAKTITPTKSSQTAVAKDVYTTGVITVGAIPSEYITTSDATAIANEIFDGETAYVNGSKVTGTFTIEEELTEQNDLISQISTLVATKANPQSGEDVTAETNAYTTKLASLETAVATLESELEGKASGGGSVGGFESNTETCSISIKSDYMIDGVGYYGTDGHSLTSISMTKHNISAICGSVIYITQSGFYSANVSAGEIIQSWSGIGLTYRVPSTPTSVSINITTD